MLSHRPDIDGLRAVAVIPVILFHAGLGLAPGGYVGVDVFFVISGFLITSLLRADIREKSFSIVDFYERRARRLLPALAVVVTATLCGGWWIMMPRALTELGQSAIATMAFLSNVFFWLEADYFAQAAEDLPLLHTWSLAVEEQFYLLFPPLLVLLLRWGENLTRGTLWCLTLGSLVTAEYLLGSAPEQAFYLTHARAWELFVGALVALDAIPPLRTRLWRDVASILGLAAIGAATVAFDAGTSFPGLAATIPVVGTALVIHSGRHGPSAAGRMLSARPIVAIGLISYSLYLWHWPVFVMQRFYSVTHPTTKEIVLAVLIVFVLAWLSWRYIEQPFRGRRSLLNRRQLFTAAGTTAIVIAVFGLAIDFTHGAPKRFPPELIATVSAAHHDEEIRKRCFGLDAARYAAGEFCSIGVKSRQPEFLLWGDSHSLSLLTVLDAEARSHGRSGVYVGASGCPPLLDVQLGNRSAAIRQQCRAASDAARTLIEGLSSLRHVIMAARWGYLVEPLRPHESANDRILLTDGSHPNAAIENNSSIVHSALSKTLKRIAESGKSAVVLESIPEPGIDVPKAYTTASVLGLAELNLGQSLDAYRQATAATRNILTQAAKQADTVTVMPVSDVLCDSRHCAVSLDDDLLYFDDNHLTSPGAALIAAKLSVQLGWRQ